MEQAYCTAVSWRGGEKIDLNGLKPDAVRKAWEEEQKAAEAEKRPVQDISISLRPGKSMEEYQRKLNELAIQETDFEPKKVPLSLFEGLDLTSAELEPFIFMISED